MTLLQVRFYVVFLVLTFITEITALPVFSAQEDLSVLSLDDLLNLEVVSVAKVPGKVSKTPAAIFIITQEDIRRSGVNSIPDALRMVPGMHVYQIDANKWAVSARGFASRFSNKMLVMVDGRTVYSPLFSGTFWDSQDLMLEDIERIEVIRGPGGTLWGANAVNGVINIISKDTADSQGGFLKTEVGANEHESLSARYGGWLNDRIAYRISGKFTDQGDYPAVADGDAADNWRQGRLGFRTDMNLAGANKITFQGGIYDGESGQSVRYVSPRPPFSNLEEIDAPISGGNLLGRWTRTFSSDSEIILQAYYDRTKRKFLVDETLDTVDVDFQHRYTLHNSIELLWGLGYRHTNDDTRGNEIIPGINSYLFYPTVREDNLYSGFLQGRLPFGGDKGELTLGTKIEHNDHTGIEWQPSTRAIWSFNEMHSIWAAVSRSVRTPSRIELDAKINAGAFALQPSPPNMLVSYIRLEGNDETEAEKVWSYEIGYRVRPVETFFLDTTVFYNKYKDLINAVPDGIPFVENTFSNTYIILPLDVINGMNGETFGVELSAQWSIKEWWRLTAGYTWFHFNELNKGISRESRQGFSEGNNAEHQVSLISYMDLPGNFELNASLYYVDTLTNLGFVTKTKLESRVRLDFNVAYYPNENWTISVGARNLLENSSQEFTDTMDGIVASEIPRILYATVAYNF